MSYHADETDEQFYNEEVLCSMGGGDCSDNDGSGGSPCDGDCGG